MEEKKEKRPLVMDLDPETASLEELQSYRNEVEEEALKIKAQIDLAEAQKEQGISIDPVWLARANSAKRYKAAILQRLTWAIKKRTKERSVREAEQRRAESLQQKSGFLSRFYDHCKATLEPETFRHLCNLSQNPE